MSVNLPTVGRIVHFFPQGNDILAAKENNNYAEMLPATVIQIFGTCINLVVTTANWEVMHVRRLSVPHKSTALESQSYWDWPTISTPAQVVEGNFIKRDGTSGDTTEQTDRA